ncbi:MAG: hypothetical protein O3A01_07355 [bacterium]|nr:hypothetical protein [bacterium]
MYRRISIGYTRTNMFGDLNNPFGNLGLAGDLALITSASPASSMAVKPDRLTLGVKIHRQ